MTMSPTFPVSLCTSLLPSSSVHASEPLICIGAADGHVWLSIPHSVRGSLPGTSGKGKKKAGKGPWRGLREEGLRRLEVGTGFVVGW